jgi:hypothetical protein
MVKAPEPSGRGDFEHLPIARAVMLLSQDKNTTASAGHNLSMLVSRPDSESFSAYVTVMISTCSDLWITQKKKKAQTCK